MVIEVIAVAGHCVVLLPDAWTFGWRRAEIVSAAMNGISLLVMRGLVTYDASRWLNHRFGFTVYLSSCGTPRRPMGGRRPRWTARGVDGSRRPSGEGRS
jgi:hypothetical protein